MRAVEFQEYGGPEVLKVAEADVPEPGPGQVTVDVAYAGVNFADVKARAEGYRVPRLPYVPGLEVSGTIRAVGEGVEGLSAGGEVAQSFVFRSKKNQEIRMAEPRIPTIDLQPWLDGGPADRARIARTVDQALQTAGFLLVTGHGVDPGLRARIRATARSFFTLPVQVKQAYEAKVGGRGWLGPGAEANGYAEGTETPPDLKESLTFATHEPFDDPAVNAQWYAPNVWPAEVPELQGLCEEYLGKMAGLERQLLDLLGDALGLERDFFSRHMDHPTYGFNINWYPGTEVIGEPEPGQFRIGPHTDFGTVTILDRQAGKGGLQVWTDAGGWEDAPCDPAAFTINIGDLMARWTGDRWRSGRHRVLPPPADAPDEELMSLVYFGECTPGTLVESVPAPVGRVAYEPVDSHVYLRQKLDSITVG